MAATELYERLETNSSLEALMILANELPEPLILMGGWAVFFTVNESYSKEHNSDYIGSRDVDLGFRIDVESSLEELMETNFAKTLKILKRVGYSESGTSRFCMYIDRRNGNILSEKDASNVPIYELFYLYVDPMVDGIHPRHDEVFSIKPIDEPLLAYAIDKKKMRRYMLKEKTILMPEPDILLAMKLSSFPRRTKDNKKVKDACDIYALLWHSGISVRKIIDSFRNNHWELLAQAKDHFTNEISRRASYHLGIESKRYMGVISQLFK